MSMRIIILAGFFVALSLSASAQLAYITFLNNSPDPALRSADVYVTQAGTVSKVAGIGFQLADNLTSVAIFGDLEVTISVAPAGSIGTGEALAEYSFTPGSDQSYMVIASGVRNTSGYVPNPDGKPIGISMTHFAVDESVSDPNKSGVYFYNGSTDLEASDVWVRGGARASATAIKFQERNATPSVVDRKSAIIDFTKPNDKTKLIASFSVDFSALGSNVVICVASGFKTPADNNSSQDTLALLSVLEDGRVVKSSLIAGSQTSRVQIIHNSADPSLATVDVWINGTKAQDNVAFRKATAFTALPANTPLVVGIAPATSTQYRDTLFTVTLDPLRPGRTYHLVATGVADSSMFRKNPDQQDISFKILALEGALESSSEAGKTAVRVGHYSTDTNRITLQSSAATYANQIAYGSSSPEYTVIPAGMDTIWVVDAAGTKIRGFICDLRGTNKAVFVMASGFSVPDSNRGGQSFKLILVEANGSVNATLQEISPSTTSVQETAWADSWILGPNPTGDIVRISIPVSAGSAVPDAAHIVSVTGQVLHTVPLTVGSTTADASIVVSQLPSGAYRLSVTSGDGSVLGTTGLMITR